MSPLALGILTMGLLLLVFLASWAAYSLRGFSQSRLQELCHSRNQPERFIEIQQQRASLLVAVEILLIPFLVGVIASGIAWGELLKPHAVENEWNSWFDYGLRWLGLVASLLGARLILPSGLGRAAGESFIVQAWPMLLFVKRMTSPLTWLVNWVDTLLHRLFDVDEPDINDPEQIVDEVRAMIAAGVGTGVIHKNAGQMLEQVVELQDADVAQVMTPRTEMFCVSDGLTFETALQTVIQSGHTRLPLIGKSADDVLGVLYAKDMLKFVGTPAPNIPPLSRIAREPFYVPETTSIGNLLDSMNRKRQHLAMVLDEFGGIAGLVTMEDLLEEIVGEIVDEYDEFEADPIRRISSTTVEVAARTHIDDLVEEFGYELPEDRDYDTIGGFTYSTLGRIPTLGEQFEYGSLRVTVLDCGVRKIHRLRLELDESLQPVTQDEE